MNGRLAIDAIINAAKSTGLVTFVGEAQLLEWRKSTSRDGPKIKFALCGDEEIVPFETATIRKGKTAGQRYVLLAFEIGDDEMPAASAQANATSLTEKETQKPYGKHASELRRLGFFYNPKVLEAIGTDEQFLEWVRRQPCAMTGEFDITEDSHGNYLERCEAAHVRRIAGGAGMAEKPPYCAIPLVRFWHDAQTKHGERVFDTTNRHTANPDGDLIRGREWMEKQRGRYVVEWATQRLAETFGKVSMGHVEPAMLLEWAEEHGVEHSLPPAYRERRE